MGTLRVDSKGRLTLPKDLRDELELAPGDTLFFEREGAFLRLGKAVSPFETLAAEAVREWRAGRTTPLRSYREQGRV